MSLVSLQMFPLKKLNLLDNKADWLNYPSEKHNELINLLTVGLVQNLFQFDDKLYSLLHGLEISHYLLIY